MGGNDEFVEIRNKSATNIPIGGFLLQGCAAASGAASDRATVPAGTVLKPGQSFLFANNGAGGYSGAVTPDATYGTGFTDFAASNQSGIRFSTPSGDPLDGVGSPGSPCREGTGFTTSATATSRSSASAARRTPTTTSRTSSARRSATRRT